MCRVPLIIVFSLSIILLALLSIASAPDFHQVPMGELRYFENEEILREWVSTHKLSIVMIGGGSLIGANPSDPRYDCDEYAEDLRRLAESEGYILTPVPVMSGCIWNIKVIDVPDKHVGNWTMVGNTYYYVEPFPSKSCVVRIINAD